MTEQVDKKKRFFRDFLGRKMTTAWFAISILGIVGSIVAFKTGQLEVAIITAIVSVCGLAFGFNGVEYISDAYKNKVVKVIAFVFLFSGGAMLAQAEDNHYFQPSKYEQSYEYKQIGKQLEAYRTLKAIAYKSHDREDFIEASYLALWPMQKAWLLNNQGYFYIQDNYRKGYSVSGLKEAEGWLLEAFGWCEQEDSYTGGKDGTKACLAKIEYNLIYVRTKLEALGVY